MSSPLINMSVQCCSISGTSRQNLADAFQDILHITASIAILSANAAHSTELTPEGYAVESNTEKGSVQIYPAKALELWEINNGNA